ncbi:MAG: hypothetical protein L3J66_09655 [Bacteroidales bacterium]|nr:hypothetical protein [Bacteroidales bacterium]
MKKIITAVLCLVIASTVFSNNLQITSVSWDPALSQVSFDISWENSWRDSTDDFHDAVWVFVKYAPNGGPAWKHANISAVTIPAPLMATVPSDQKGAFVRRSAMGYGTVTATTLTFDVLNTDLGPFPDFKVFGIEMVNIPGGAYYLGGSVTSASDYHFHRGDDVNEGFYVNTSGILPYGSTSGTWATTSSFGYTTDIPAAYPNGFDQFYAMKYPVTQEQYVEFLNTLTFEQQNTRTESDLNALTVSTQYVMSGIDTVYPFYRNGIKADYTITPGFPVTFFCDLNENGVPNEIDDGQNLVCNFVNYDDWLAYADWSALRPLTMLEHEKMCRGPLNPVLDERAWGIAGTTAEYSYSTLTNPGEPSESHPAVGSPGLFFYFICRVGIAATSSSTRLTASAGYYGNLHLSAYTADFFVAAEAANYGLGFTGVPGDGVLTTSGDYLNADWSTIGGGNVRKGRNAPIVEISNGTGAPQSRNAPQSFRLGR